MDHLSGLDALFLYLETPETPMHVGGLNIVELPAGYEGDFLADFRRLITSRMHLAPVFQRKLVNMPFELANPVWVADDDVDVEYHIRSTVHWPPAAQYTWTRPRARKMPVTRLAITMVFLWIVQGTVKFDEPLTGCTTRRPFATFTGIWLSRFLKLLNPVTS